MTTLDERERAFETLFVREQDAAFRSEARRSRKVALWAAGQMGFFDAEADRYVAETVSALIAQGGSVAVVAKLRQDLERHGVTVTEQQLRSRMNSVTLEPPERPARD